MILSSLNSIIDKYTLKHYTLRNCINRHDGGGMSHVRQAEARGKSHYG